MGSAKDQKVMGFESLIVILSLSCLVVALGVNGAIRNDLLLDPNSILKTIESEESEMIDCVDIYKQPAFSHPRLRNHTLQMKPTSYPIGYKPKGIFHSNNSLGMNFQKWHKNGEYCPKGTIPIVRSSEETLLPKTTHPLTSSTNSLTPAGYEAEFAVAFLPGTNFHGAIGDISIWNPKTLDKEVSGAQCWVTDGGGKNIDSVEAGWKVTTGSNHPTLFVYWTADGYNTGCMNVRCPGFVQTNHKVALGAVIQPPSTYGGDQRQLRITIHRDDGNGNWWFNLEGEDVGYWPPNLFNGGLRGTASLVEWGGVVVNSNPGGFHTSTQMGSGHFPDEGYGKAAWFKNLKYISKGGRVKDAKKIMGHPTRPACYDIEVPEWDDDMGIHFFYGGPGYNPLCQH